MSEKEHPHLTLVPAMTAEERRDAERREWFAKAMEWRPYNAGSFQDVLDHRDELLRSISTPKGTNVADLIEDALHNDGSKIRMDHTFLDNIRRIAGEITRDILIGAQVAFEELDRPQKDVRAHLREFENLCLGHARVCHLERLESLLREHGVYVRDTDAIRLIVYDLNQNRLVPRVLAIPNHYKEYNPFYTLVPEGTALPADLASFLRVFNN